jgi:hypothetical protein
MAEPRAEAEPGAEAEKCSALQRLAARLALKLALLPLAVEGFAECGHG